MEEETEMNTAYIEAGVWTQCVPESRAKTLSIHQGQISLWAQYIP